MGFPVRLAATASDCYSCPAGFSCSDEGVSDHTAYPCPPGHYCVERTLIPAICPAGTFRNETHGTGIGDCSPCAAGFYCPVRNCLPELGPDNSSSLAADDMSYFTDFNFSIADSNSSNAFANGSLSDAPECDYDDITCPTTCQCDAGVTVDSHIHGIPCKAGRYCL